MKYMIDDKSRLLEDFYYNILYIGSILYNIPILTLYIYRPTYDVEDASHCLFSFLTLLILHVQGSQKSNK